MMRKRLPRRLARFGTVRVRTTVGAILVVGLTLLVSSFVLVVMVRRSLTNNVEVAAEFRAESAVALLEGGVSPRQAGMGGDDDTVIQILSRSGQVVAASRQISSRRPLMKLRPEESATVHHVVAGQPDPYRIVARGTKDGRYLVLVGESLEQVRESTAAIVRVLLAIDPVLLVLMTAITWVVTGRALRPVESIRREVAAIGSERLDRRVPEPRGHDEIARLAHTMNAMLERLERSRERQRRFVSDASHELRSPIATIRHQLETAIAHPDLSNTQELAPELLAENLHMERLVEDLLLLARADENTLAVRRRPVDLDDLLLAEAARVRSLRSIEVTTTDIHPVQILGDPLQLSRLVRNLVDNAVRHAATRIALGLTSDATQLRLTVSDDGDGVAEADAQRIFERFTRLDRSRARDTGGTGLGLAIVAEVARAHGGRVHVEAVDADPHSTKPRGARFVVVLPIEKSEAR